MAADSNGIASGAAEAASGCASSASSLDECKSAELTPRSLPEDEKNLQVKAVVKDAKIAVRRGVHEFEAYYGLQQLCSTENWQLSLERFQQPLPPCFRVPQGLAGTEELEPLLRVLREWEPLPVAWCPGAFRLHASSAVGPDGHYDLQLDRTLSAAQRAGSLCRQETASMLPGIALGIEPHHSVLELCAAPGSKTLQLLDLMQPLSLVPSGLLVSNDYKPVRLKKLIDRTRRVPAAPLLATCADARRFPNLHWAAAGKVRFDRVLCDVPCSGDGTVRKARGLLAQWTARGGLAHHEDQLCILRRGLELLAPGGLLAYSTCALNPVECEAVVASALFQSAGSVRIVPVTIPGLQLAEGLTSWRVPAPKGRAATEEAPPGGETFGSWDEVPEADKSAGRIRRSMFPPAAYTASPAAASEIAEKLRGCGRLLPAHDDGGCFFVAVLERVEHVASPPKRGDTVLVRSACGEDVEAVVRGPGSGRFTGLVRVAYPDGSQYHARPDDLQRPGSKIRESTTSTAKAPTFESTDSFDVEGETSVGSQAPLLRPAESKDWQAVADFYGLIADPAEADAAGVQPFPREALVCALEPAAGDTGDVTPSVSSLCLASAALRRIAWAPRPRAAARAVFFRDATQAPSDIAKAGDDAGARASSTFSWLPSAEAAPLLLRCCTRRVMRPSSISAVRQLLESGEAEAEKLGLDKMWQPGAVIVEIPGNLGVPALIGRLQAGSVRLLTRVEVRRHLLARLKIAGEA